MKCLTINNVANINQPPNNFDSNALAQLLAWLITGLTGILTPIFYLIHRYYKNKSEERKEFIESLAKNITDESIKDFKEMFERHMEHMERKMDGFTKTVQDIYRDISRTK